MRSPRKILKKKVEAIYTSKSGYINKRLLWTAKWLEDIDKICRYYNKRIHSVLRKKDYYAGSFSFKSMLTFYLYKNTELTTAQIAFFFGVSENSIQNKITLFKRRVAANPEDASKYELFEKVVKNDLFNEA